jgi:hypothetical protein
VIECVVCVCVCVCVCVLRMRKRARLRWHRHHRRLDAAEGRRRAARGGGVYQVRRAALSVARGLEGARDGCCRARAVVVVMVQAR